MRENSSSVLTSLSSRSALRRTASSLLAGLRVGERIGRAEQSSSGPSISVSGVRNSWLTLLKKAVFARSSSASASARRAPPRARARVVEPRSRSGPRRGRGTRCTAVVSQQRAEADHQHPPARGPSTAPSACASARTGPSAEGSSKSADCSTGAQQRRHRRGHRGLALRVQRRARGTGRAALAAPVDGEDVGPSGRSAGLLASDSAAIAHAALTLLASKARASRSAACAGGARRAPWRSSR